MRAVLLAAALCGSPALLAQPPLERAVGYLSTEVEKWPRENGCFSCHNNGDAVRALLAARRAGHALPAETLAASFRFLADPTKWDEGKESPFNDKHLARLQFAAALADAVRDGDIPAASLQQAARDLAAQQAPDGSWRVEPDRDPGAPATWGTALATALTARVMEQAGIGEAARRGRAWLERTEPRYTADRAALVMAGVARHAAALAAVQTSDGGWGPIPKTPAEVFDTAVVLLALDRTQYADAVRRGRAFLLAAQQPAGGWPETTRPSGSQSYAEHISTSAWATLALLLTDDKR